MSRLIRRLGIVAIAIAAIATSASNAWGAASDPLFVVVPQGAAKTLPPVGYLEGACGVAVASSGDFYVSDYYHHAIDAFNTAGSYTSQISNEDPLDGPCGLAFNSLGTLYVNNYHRNVTNLSAGAALALPSEDTATHLPTGVAVDPTTNTVYVDNRTYLTAFNSSGAQLMEGGEPLRIGAGNIGDGHGLAVSGFPGTVGKIYVPDAAANTVKIFDPTLSKTDPQATLHGPGKGFNSLRDAAIAIDRFTGNIYVVDDLQPTATEEPEAVVDVFSSANAFLGVLKYKIYDALPPGIAIDNSANSTQGRVYVTSGNTDRAGIYAYAPNSQTNGFLPPSIGLVVKSAGSGGGVVRSPTAGIDCTAECEAQPFSGSEVTLTATPDKGSDFAGWTGGDCSGINATCTVTMSEARSITASFAAESPPAGREAAAFPSTPPASLANASPTKTGHNRKARHRHRHHRAKHRHRTSRRG